MKYTKQKPTESGEYWLKDPDNHMEPEVVYITCCQEVKCIGTARLRSLSNLFLDCLWYHIKPPEDK